MLQSLQDEANVQLFLRWGERMLEAQERMQRAELGLAADMLRLSVAVVGGLIVVVGILATGDWAWDVFVLVFFGIGVIALVTSAFMLAAILARPSRVGGLAYGPDMNELLSLAMAADASKQAMIFTVAGALPGLIQMNEQVIASLQHRKGRALTTLTGAVVAILGGLVYMLGGAIIV